MESSRFRRDLTKGMVVCITSWAPLTVQISSALSIKEVWLSQVEMAALWVNTFSHRYFRQLYTPSCQPGGIVREASTLRVGGTLAKCSTQTLTYPFCICANRYFSSPKMKLMGTKFNMSRRHILGTRGTSCLLWNIWTLDFPTCLRTWAEQAVFPFPCYFLQPNIFFFFSVIKA